MIDRRLFIHFDWTLLGITLLIACIGILNLYSGTSGGEVTATPYYVKQIFWLLIGLALMIPVAFIEYRFYSDFAYFVYAIAFGLLLAVLGYGIITSVPSDGSGLELSLFNLPNLSRFLSSWPWRSSSSGPRAERATR